LPLDKGYRFRNLPDLILYFLLFRDKRIKRFCCASIVVFSGKWNSLQFAFSIFAVTVVDPFTPDRTTFQGNRFERWI